jgi:hypothetical protein
MIHEGYKFSALIEAYNMEIGLLINFGGISLEFKRLTRKKSQNHNHHFKHSSDNFPFTSSPIHNRV